MKTTSRGAATSRKLLDTALGIFAREGLDGLTVHSVVARSGVSLGSLYHAFGSADGLAAALYSRCLGAWLEAVAAALEGKASAREVVVRIVVAYLDFAAREPTMARFVHASSYASFIPKNAPEIARHVAEKLAPIEARLRPHMAKGRIVALSPALLEVLIIGPAAEATRRWLSGDERLAPSVTREVIPLRVWKSVALVPRKDTSDARSTPPGASRTKRVKAQSSSSRTRRTSS